jgi:hypothetical protein
MKREDAKNLFRKDLDSYGKPKGIMGKIDLIYDDVEFQEAEIQFLRKTVKEQKDLINTMRDVLKFCARGEVGTYYQQQSAREMAINNTHVVWDRYNPDGSTTEDYRKWIFQCAEGRKKGSGKRALKKLDDYEKELQIK